MSSIPNLAPLFKPVKSRKRRILRPPNLKCPNCGNHNPLLIESMGKRWKCQVCGCSWLKNPLLVPCHRCGKLRKASLIGKTRICPQCGSDHTEIRGSVARNLSQYRGKAHAPKQIVTFFSCC